MARVFFLLLISLFLPLVVRGQWIPVPVSQGTTDRFLYVNASANGQYEYVKHTTTGLKSGIINADGSLGPIYSYPTLKGISIRATHISYDTTIFLIFAANRLPFPALDTIQIASMVRGNFILDLNRTIYLASRGFNPNAFKLKNEYIFQTDDSIFVYDNTTFRQKIKYKAFPMYSSFFYEGNVLTGLQVENHGSETWLTHGTYNPTRGLFLLETTNIIKFGANFNFTPPNYNNAKPYGIETGNDSITYPFIWLGQLVQKKGTRRYFFRKTNNPPYESTSGQVAGRKFAATKSLDSIYYVNRNALPNGGPNGQHLIYHFNRASTLYELVDSAYTDKISVDDFHTCSGNAIIVASSYYPRIKQFPLSTPKEVEWMPEQPMGVYPNPASSSLQLRLGSGHVGGTYTILDALGRTCLKGDYVPDQTLDIQALAPGLYHVRVSIGSSTFTSRFVKH